jgi:hypothetical protein
MKSKCGIIYNVMLVQCHLKKLLRNGKMAAAASPDDLSLIWLIPGIHMADGDNGLAQPDLWPPQWDSSKCTQHTHTHTQICTYKISRYVSNLQKCLLLNLFVCLWQSDTKTSFLGQKLLCFLHLNESSSVVNLAVGR